MWRNKVTDVRTLSTDELRKRLDRDSGLHLLNVQTDQWFTGELIPGSRRVPLDTLGEQSVRLPKDAEIVTYCGGPRCSQSTEAARKLADFGYTNVSVYKEGLEGWKTAGNEVVTPQPVPAA
jgi:rhodanese-related sulfurtransferase